MNDKPVLTLIKGLTSFAISGLFLFTALSCGEAGDDSGASLQQADVLITGATVTTERSAGPG